MIAIPFGGLLVFDMNRMAKNGEPQVATVRYGYCVQARYTDFLKFFEETDGMIRQGLKRLNTKKR